MATVEEQVRQPWFGSGGEQIPYEIVEYEQDVVVLLGFVLHHAKHLVDFFFGDACAPVILVLFYV